MCNTHQDQRKTNGLVEKTEKAFSDLIDGVYNGKKEQQKDIEQVRERVDEITSKEDISDAEVDELVEWVLMEKELLD